MSRKRRIVRLVGRLRERLAELDEASTAKQKRALVAKLAKQPKVRDPEALAAYIGRRIGGLRRGRAEASFAENAKEAFEESATSLARKLKSQGKSAEEAKKAIVSKLQTKAAKKFLDPPEKDDEDAPVSPEAASDALAAAVPGKGKPEPEELANDDTVKGVVDKIKGELADADDLDAMSDLIDDMIGDGKRLPARFDDDVAALGKSLGKASPGWRPGYSPAFKKYAKKGMFSFLKELKERFQYYSGMITDGITEATQIALSVFPGVGGGRGGD